MSFIQTPDFHRSRINHVINSKKSISELIPILLNINMDPDVLKNAMKQTVNELKLSEVGNVFYSSINIEQILPTDIIQNIESFNHSVSMKSVSKKFKKCFIKNENIQLRKRELEIDKQLNVTTNNNQWIVHSQSNNLHSDQMDQDNTVDTLQDALNRCIPGDSILMHNGVHTFDVDHIFNKDIKLIGIGNKVILDFPENEDVVNVDCKLYLKNLKLSMASSCSDGIQLKHNSSLWIEQCKIRRSLWGIVVTPESNLCATNCIFVASTSQFQAINIESANEAWTKARKIAIINCIFEGYGLLNDEPTISIPKYEFHSKSFMFLGNYFKNMKGPPIGLSYNDTYMHRNDGYPKKRNRIFRLNQVTFRDNGLFRYLDNS